MNNISVRINNTDTQDNANGLYIRILETDEITDIYNEHIVTDFPASEVKPLSQMLRKREQGQYFVYGMFEDNGELAGYAYFIKCSNKDVYLLDYLAIVKNKRSKHLGSTFLQELKNLNQEVITMSQMVQDAIETASHWRDKFGAQQERLEHAVRNTDNTSQNTQSAESGIRDTNMNMEMVLYSTNRILVHASQSILAQYNDDAKSVLEILK